jgi:hypothetical protein
MAERKVVSFDEFYYQLKLMHLFLLHPVYENFLSLSNINFDICNDAALVYCQELIN